MVAISMIIMLLMMVIFDVLEYICWSPAIRKAILKTPLVSGVKCMG